jgi:hypothetical protein
MALTMRILAFIAILGPKIPLEQLSSHSAIQDGSLYQLGLKMRNPPPDSWKYMSPIYRFDADSLDEDLYSFLLANEGLGKFLCKVRDKVEFALLTVMPVEQTFEETFSCLLSQETLSKLTMMGLGLEIAPEVIMPEYPFWKERNEVAQLGG